jgi:negative regulator of flagellin synthesis FlgM
MKIDNSGKALGAIPARPLEGRAAAKAEQAAEKDSVSINSLAAKLSNESTFDTKKVDEIRQAISEGRFSVNSSKIADGLLSSVKELLAR